MSGPDIVRILNQPAGGPETCFQEKTARMMHLSTGFAKTIAQQTPIRIDDNEISPNGGDCSGRLTIPISEDDIIVRMFRNWLDSSCERLHNSMGQPRLTLMGCFKLYAFAEKHGIARLANFTVDKVRTEYQRGLFTMVPSAVTWLFRHCHSDSGLCSMVADIYAIMIGQESWTNWSMPKHFYRKVLESVCYYRVCAPKPAVLGKIDHCAEYHRHEDEDRCQSRCQSRGQDEDGE